jgi:superfamily II DNA or RNA helicase
MALDGIHILEEYRTGEQDLVESFYKPCVKEAIIYDRAVGYFRSTVFLLIGPDLIEFAKRGGKMRLICSPVLTPEDFEAIAGGYQLRADRLSEALMMDFDILYSDEMLRSNTEALATLISIGVIDLKIAFRPEGHGIYHEKIGVFKDDRGNVVSFKGSVNESWNGWHDRGNYESFDTYCSWDGVKENLRVKNSEQYFERLWNGELEAVHVVDLPNVVRERIKMVAKESIDAIDIAALYQIKNAEPEAGQQGNKRKPLPHQLAAINGWIAQGRRGVFEHATGSGKTFTALTAMKEHLDEGGVVLVLVPDSLLHKQWGEEIKKEYPDATILKAGDGNNRWRKNKRLRHFTQPGKDLGQRVVLVTMPTARTADFREGVWQGDHLMIVADEVHEIGGTENAKAMTIKTGPRLGLSATPRRYGDAAGTFKIFDYFGPVVEPPFTLIDAIKQGRLVEYEYHPAPIRLTAEESEAWEVATKEISLEFARSKRDDTGAPVMSPRIQNMLIQRSRIAKKASAKVPYAVKTVVDNYTDGQSWLVYCEDQHQLRDVMDALRARGYEPCEYHTNMRGDAAASLDWFKRFGGIMVSIRCLDQGVDIPKISHAVILASSQNPRQFIQRRGRVLRVCPGKYHAVIYDAVVVPICLDQEPGQLSLLKSELQRSIQFSGTAMNRSGSNKLFSIAIDLGIDPEEIGLADTDGIEEPGESYDDKE